MAKTTATKKLLKKISSKVPVKTKEKSNNVPENTKYSICASIRSNKEPHLRCLLRTKNNNKYCPMHLLQNNIVEYQYSSFDEDILIRDEKINATINNNNNETNNEIIKKINIDDLLAPKRILQKESSSKLKNKTDITIYEQKKSTVENDYQETEDDLEIKLLIIANDEKYVNTISKLIGPVFSDITISEDEQDPITYDKIWIIENGKKKAAAINKYYLFSYIDSNNKIRCMTIFTINDMIENDDFIHPLTMEKIPDQDINRAKQLVEFYKTKIGLFKENEIIQTPEYKLSNRINRLFKKFHTHSIYFEEKWLMDLDDEEQLYKIIKETEKIISANYKLINPNLTTLKLFQIKKNSKYDDAIIDLKEYIVDQWEKLIDASSGPENQLPIWILASGLSSVVSDIKQKYPNVELM